MISKDVYEKCGKPHISELPYDNRTNDPEKLQKRKEVIQERLDKTQKDLDDLNQKKKELETENEEYQNQMDESANELLATTEDFDNTYFKEPNRTYSDELKEFKEMLKNAEDLDESILPYAEGLPKMCESLAPYARDLIENGKKIPQSKIDEFYKFCQEAEDIIMASKERYDEIHGMGESGFESSYDYWEEYWGTDGPDQILGDFPEGLFVQEYIEGNQNVYLKNKEKYDNNMEKISKLDKDISKKENIIQDYKDELIKISG